MMKCFVMLLRAGFLAAGALLLLMTLSIQFEITPPVAVAQQAGAGPANTLGTDPTTDFWRSIRQGERGTVSIPNERAGVMIQTEGQSWLEFRNGPLSTYGMWALAAIVGLLLLFFLVRGRIRIDAGPSGQRVTRFNAVERFGHWLTAVSFIILGLSGLNMLYGRDVLKPVLGADAFAQLTFYGKLFHNYVAFAFMIGLAIILVAWIKDNFPSRTDINWMLKGGGMFTRNTHPPAKKFNAGQKLIFWLVVIGGISISLSGLSLMFPFQMPMFAKTFEVVNALGFEAVAGYALPTTLTPMEEMQLSQAWHAMVGLGLIVVIIAHIYIGTVGMEGAFDAMGSGEVDANWAREHHSIWYEEVRKGDHEARHDAGHEARQQPAE